MPVIAMPHEIGTLGREIARGLAQRLRIDLADSSYLGQRIADRLSKPRARFDRNASNPGAFADCLDVDDTVLGRAADEEIRELAAYGNIIMRGWGAASILRDNPYVLRLRVTSPLELRIRRLGKHEGIRNPDILARMIEDADRCLATNLEPVVGPVWREHHVYHLSLAGQSLPVAAIVDQLAAYVAAATKSRRPGWHNLARTRRVRPLPAPRKPQSTGEDIDLVSVSRAERKLFTPG
jgi:hypothetical protein